MWELKFDHANEKMFLQNKLFCFSNKFEVFTILTFIFLRKYLYVLKNTVKYTQI